ncbi:MAG: hypothetical protein QM800_06890 [Paludibacter sp.]
MKRRNVNAPAAVVAAVAVASAVVAAVVVAVAGNQPTVCLIADVKNPAVRQRRGVSLPVFWVGGHASKSTFLQQQARA